MVPEDAIAYRIGVPGAPATDGPDPLRRLAVAAAGPPDPAGRPDHDATGCRRQAAGPTARRRTRSDPASHRGARRRSWQSCWSGSRRSRCREPPRKPSCPRPGRRVPRPPRASSRSCRPRRRPTLRPPSEPPSRSASSSSPAVPTRKPHRCHPATGRRDPGRSRYLLPRPERRPGRPRVPRRRRHRHPRRRQLLRRRRHPRPLRRRSSPRRSSTPARRLRAGPAPLDAAFSGDDLSWIGRRHVRLDDRLGPVPARARRSTTHSRPRARTWYG